MMRKRFPGLTVMVFVTFNVNFKDSNATRLEIKFDIQEYKPVGKIWVHADYNCL